MTHPFPLAAVLGHPIAHSRSPQMHRYWLQKYGIAGDYTAIDVAPNRLESVLRMLPDLGFRGVNLTIPHKVDVMQIADCCTDAARSIGAANTIFFTENGITADNTDAFGFIENLRQNAGHWDPSKPALVLGAGGAARAVIWALKNAGVQDVRLSNRSIEKANFLADQYGFQVVPWEDRHSACAGVGTVVNTTSLGMKGQPRLELDLTDLESSAVVTDIVYTPLETDLLAAARSKGCTIVDGLGMLLYQAVPGFKGWFGQQPEVTQGLRRIVLS